jgi:DNA-binding transcriptional MerR regulator
LRCLSSHAKYSIQVIEGDEEIVVDPRGHATTVSRRKPVIANFDKTGLLDYEIEAALENLTFTGIPDGVNPLTRVSTFDTEAYCESRYGDDKELSETEREHKAEMQEKIDQRLRKLQARHPNEFIIVEAPRHETPWSNYDEQDVETILKLQEQTGISPEKVRLYELENQNRPEVIEAMERLEDPAAFEEKIEVNA